MKLPIYLDCHATTPMDPKALEAMLPYFRDVFGNSASRNHRFGWEAENAVDGARGQIARILGCDAKEVIFTSGATEANNLAIKGVAEMHRERGDHIVTAVTEHKAVLDTCKRLERNGFRVTYLPVDQYGMVHPEAVREAIEEKTILVSLMLANNEVGTINPLKEIGAVTREKGVLLHTDATQGVGKTDFDVEEMNVDLASLSAHKIYGPKGVGALYVRRRKPRVRLAPLLDGGGHERGMRSGTINVPGVVGFGAACEIARKGRAEEEKRVLGLREKLHRGILSKLDEVKLNGHPEKRLAGNLNLSFAYVEGESLMMGINDIAVSSGSACTSASLEPSYVLKALGVEDELAHSSIRFGLGRFTTEEEIDYTAARVVEVVSRLRDMSPLYEMAKEGIDLKSIAWTGH